MTSSPFPLQELPPELVEEVLSRMGPRELTRTLSASKTMKSQYKSGMDPRITRDKLWFRALANTSPNPDRSEKLYHTPLTIGSMLGPGFPRTGPDASYTLVTEATLGQWFLVYFRLNQLYANTRRNNILIDDFLEKVTGYTKGMVVNIGRLMGVIISKLQVYFGSEEDYLYRLKVIENYLRLLLGSSDEVLSLSSQAFTFAFPKTEPELQSEHNDFYH